MKCYQGALAVIIFIESYDHWDGQLAKRMTSDEWIASVKTMQPLINTKVLIMYLDNYSYICIGSYIAHQTVEHETLWQFPDNRLKLKYSNRTVSLGCYFNRTVRHRVLPV